MSEITLDQLLASRDRRVERQAALLEGNPGSTLICLTVQFPGRVKRTPESLIVAEEGVNALLDTFGSSVRMLRKFDPETGFEAYMLVDKPSSEAKKATCGIENSHPLGRLMDIDVIVLSENGPVPLSREDFGFPPRLCLLCNSPVRECMRKGSHSKEELIEAMNRMVSSYCHNKNWDSSWQINN